MPINHHITPADLSRLVKGFASRADATNLVLHLQACEECFFAFQKKYPWECKDLWTRLLGDLEDVEPAYETLKTPFRESHQVEARLAKAALSRLRQVSPEKRHLIVRNSKAFATLAAVQALLEEARGDWQGSPKGALAWAELALKAVEVLPSKKYPYPLIAVYAARAWAYRGNAKRLVSDLKSAEGDLQKASFWLEQAPPDPLDSAMLLRMEGSLARDQRRFGIAERKVRKALDLCRQENAMVRSAWLENLMGIIYLDSGDFSAAQRQYIALFRQFGHSMSSDLQCASHQNLSMAYAGCDATESAAYHLQLARSHAGPAASELLKTRLDWQQARIHIKAGRPMAATELLTKVQRTFLDAATHLDVALAGLDLTQVLGAQGKFEEARRQAEKSKAIFLERRLHSHVRRANTLLRTTLLNASS